MKPKMRPSIDDAFANPIDLVSWLEGRTEDSQTSAAQDIFDQLLTRATLPKNASTNPCAKLRGFVERCSKSKSDVLQRWAFSKDTCSNVFNFFIEWGDSDLHRSIKSVLDLLILLVSRNPSQSASELVKVTILDALISVIRHKSAKRVKPSIKAWELFTTKSLFTLEDVVSSYRRTGPSSRWDLELTIWKDFFAHLFDWLAVRSVHAAVGKIIVNTYKALRQRVASDSKMAGDDQFTVEIWHQWIQDAVSTTPDLLEEVKLYIFPALFRDDRKSSLQFLEHTIHASSAFNQSEKDLDIPALVRITALEVGKKVGIVGEPGERAESGNLVVLDETALRSVLVHHSTDVRSLALSLLISSPSSTRPFSTTGLQLLRSHLEAYFPESDGKFRMETLNNLRDMFKRVRGAIFILLRSIVRAETATNDGTKDLKGAGIESASALGKQIVYRTAVLSWPDEQLRSSLEQHKTFLEWYLKFLRNELIPTASYQRHITSLKAINTILNLAGDSSQTWDASNDDGTFFDLFDQHWARVLLDLIMDPFDDVRDTSSTILGILLSDPRFKNVMKDRQVLEKFLPRVEDISQRTSRADHADGVARANELLYTSRGSQETRFLLVSGLISRLENNIRLAEQDLGRAVLDAPIHGYFASLRCVWQAMYGSTYQAYEIDNLHILQKRIVSCCQSIWATVKSVLCDDSPEGHLPQELEELEGLDTKDILSYSFRAVHESSNLMRVMVLSLNRKSVDGALYPQSDVFVAMGTLTFDQLSSLRHRGAFSTVSATFATCCQSAKYVKETESDYEDGNLLSRWYKGANACIFAQASTTRRSAGIPAMITGILSANSSQPSFDQVIEDLIQIAQTKALVTEEDDTKLPQVHALNCLTQVFRSSFLTNLGQSEQYLPQCLELAATSLQSEIWAIRNCGLLFLRSLIDSLFGTHGSKSSLEAGWDGKASKLQYNKYPILPSVLLNLLRSGHDVMGPSTSTVAAESVFPALDIIRRDGPPEKLRDELYRLITEYTGSPVWHVRDMAARALCCFLLHDDWVQTVEKRLLSINTVIEVSSRANMLHGTLLTVKHVLDKLFDVDPNQLQRDIPLLSNVLKIVERTAPDAFAHSPETRALFVEVVNLLSSHRILRDKSAEDADTVVTDDAELQSPALTDLQPVTSRLPHSALLRSQLAVWAVYDTAQRNDLVGLQSNLLDLASTSTNAAVTMLEAIPRIWKPSTSQSRDFCNMYINVCVRSTAPELRALALLNLAELLDHLLETTHMEYIPDDKDLMELWVNSGSQAMNPTLSNAIVRISGCIMAVIVLRHSSNPSSESLGGLTHWGVMMADAGLDDKTFDTRLAAASSLKSFFTVLKVNANTSVYIPSLFALYDAMNDDDDEVRDLAAGAARGILGQHLVPVEAANGLLRWLGTTFGDRDEFRSLVVCRMVGYAPITVTITPEILNWEPAESQLAKAMEFDDALFVIEEQNLYVDEVREAQRWAKLFESLPRLENDSAINLVERWVVDGLQTVTKLGEEHDAGPLGWMSAPQVYAIVSRVILCGDLLLKLGRSTEIAETLEKLRDA